MWPGVVVVVKDVGSVGLDDNDVGDVAVVVIIVGDLAWCHHHC